MTNWKWALTRMRGVTLMTAEEFEIVARDAVKTLNEEGMTYFGDILNECLVRYKAAHITANNYKKALEALEHAN